MSFTRRQILAALAAGPVAGGLAAGVTAWQWWDRPPGAGRATLADDEHEFVQALAEAWMPPGGNPSLSGAEARLGDFLDDILSHMGHDQTAELKLLVQALDDLPRLTHRGRAFRHLPLEARIAVLDGWLHSDRWLLRNGVQALLALLAGGYTTHPEVVPMLAPWFRCGYGR